MDDPNTSGSTQSASSGLGQPSSQPIFQAPLPPQNSPTQPVSPARDIAQRQPVPDLTSTQQILNTPYISPSHTTPLAKPPSPPTKRFSAGRFIFILMGGFIALLLLFFGIKFF